MTREKTKGGASAARKRICMASEERRGVGQQAEDESEIDEQTRERRQRRDGEMPAACEMESATPGDSDKVMAEEGEIKTADAMESLDFEIVRRNL